MPRRRLPARETVLVGCGLYRSLVVRQQVDHERQQVACGLTVDLAGILQSADEARYAVQRRERDGFRTHLRPRAAS